MKKSRLTHRSQKPPRKTRLLVIIVSCLVVVISVSAWVWHQKTKPHDDPTRTTSQKGEPVVEDKTEGSSVIPAAENNEKSEGTTPSSDTTLEEPTGSFVSNHHPNLGGSPAPNNIQSSCTTTPGAKCTITLTKNGTTKSLGEKTTNDDGSAYWDWKLQDVGITEGSWQVTATANLNGQTKSATDPIALEVKP